MKKSNLLKLQLQHSVCRRLTTKKCHYTKICLYQLSEIWYYISNIFWQRIFLKNFIPKNSRNLFTRERFWISSHSRLYTLFRVYHLATHTPLFMNFYVLRTQPNGSERTFGERPAKWLYGFSKPYEYLFLQNTNGLQKGDKKGVFAQYYEGSFFGCSFAG